jgi:hypothetical protein
VRAANFEIACKQHNNKNMTKLGLSTGGYMANWFFDAPAGMKDFQDPRHWHDEMAREARDIVTELVASATGKDPRNVTDEDIRAISHTLAYVDPVASPPPEDAETIGIAPWGGFPRAVERQAPWPFPSDPDDVTGNHRAVEHLGEEDHYDGEFRDFDGNRLDLPVRDRQDEYLEWVVRRNSEGKITKAIFVAEGYDYYAALFNYDEQRVVEMYQQFTGVTQLSADDLRAPRGIKRHRTDGRIVTVAEPGQFNPRNHYNIDPGIVHLAHRANSLGAEVNLAGVSGIARRTVSGTTLRPGNAELLLCCSRGGNPSRNSDPLIGEQAYTQVLEKRRYTLANPVGLYIAAVEEQRLTLENGETIPREWWRVVRGEELWDSRKSRVLRLELEIPATERIVLGDLYVDGSPLKFGGQLAQLLSVHLFVTRWPRTDNSIGPIVRCNATCCRRTGTPELTLSTGKCDQGYELAFEDLVPVPQTPFSLLTADDVLSTPISEAAFRMNRRLP